MYERVHLLELEVEESMRSAQAERYSSPVCCAPCSLYDQYHVAFLTMNPKLDRPTRSSKL